MALWLAATRLARKARIGVGVVLAEPTILALLLIPILNIAIGKLFSAIGI